MQERFIVICMGPFSGVLTPKRALNFLVIFPLFLSVSSATAAAQTITARIDIISLAPARIRVTAELSIATNTLSFANTYAGVLGLAERIRDVQAGNPNGENVPVQKIGPGEFKAAADFRRLTYEVDVAEPSRPADMSHVSWLNPEHGLLMLSDLLPLVQKDSATFSSASIQIEPPAGWAVASNATISGNRYSADEPDKTVFLLGPAVQDTRRQHGSSHLSFVSSGKWPFTAGDGIKVVERIIEQYSKVTDFTLKREAVVMLLPYPGEAGSDKWTAETRGNDVVLLLGRNAARKNVLEMLSIVLAHELFHLWIPNSLKLDGNYDWFFEGFTLYQALRTDVRLGFVSFNEYLDTIARVYDAYLASADRETLSLIEASERRWTTTPSLVYEKGMLVAFIYDLILRQLTECKASLDDVYKQLFQVGLTGQRGQRSANETIIALLSTQEGMQPFVKSYVQSTSRIYLDPIVLPYGLRVARAGPGNATKITLAGDLNRSQRKLIGCLGY